MIHGCKDVLIIGMEQPIAKAILIWFGTGSAIHSERAHSPIVNVACMSARGRRA